MDFILRPEAIPGGEEWFCEAFRCPLKLNEEHVVIRLRSNRPAGTCGFDEQKVLAGGADVIAVRAERALERLRHFLTCACKTSPSFPHIPGIPSGNDAFFGRKARRRNQGQECAAVSSRVRLPKPIPEFAETFDSHHELIAFL